MDSIWIRGGATLNGDIPISGAKNAALTLIPCALLTDEKLTLANLPRLADVDSFSHLMNQLGVSTSVAGVKKGEFGRKVTFHANEIASTVAPYDMVRKMRASILALGPMLARAGESTVSLPGGCAIGDRPIDLHLKALEAIGAEIELAAGYVKASAPKGRLTGGDYSFPVVSVGATENVVMAAVLANGRTQLFNAAREPEIVDLCNLLVAMGAKIEGIGSSHLIIDGVEGLHGTEYEVMPDRIEAGSYACAAGITGGSINLLGARPDDMRATLNALAQAGLVIEFHDKGIKVSSNGALKPLALSTSPFPGFATDMQAQFMAMLCRAEGQSFLEETIFENRYMHVPELRRMGAEIEIHGRSAIVHGVAKLTGAEVMATDLRASMSLVLAGLAAEGETHVLRVYHLDRGYERLEEKLSAVGATIERRSAG
jgi:UDP-N-acetylglucosamine 1-carboxyvinyltransferase